MRVKTTVWLFLLAGFLAVTNLYSSATGYAQSLRKGENELFSARQLPNAELETTNQFPGFCATITLKTGWGNDLAVSGKYGSGLLRFQTDFPLRKASPVVPSYLFHIYPSHHFW